MKAWRRGGDQDLAVFSDPWVRMTPPHSVHTHPPPLAAPPTPWHKRGGGGY